MSGVEARGAKTRSSEMATMGECSLMGPFLRSGMMEHVSADARPEAALDGFAELRNLEAGQRRKRDAGDGQMRFEQFWLRTINGVLAAALACLCSPYAFATCNLEGVMYFCEGWV
jgi:hypothetical protein